MMDAVLGHRHCQGTNRNTMPIQEEPDVPQPAESNNSLTPSEPVVSGSPTCSAATPVLKETNTNNEAPSFLAAATSTPGFIHTVFGCDLDLGLRIMQNKDPTYRRSLVITPRVTTQFNQFLPSKDKPSGYVPPPLQRKHAEQDEDNGRGWANPVFTKKHMMYRSKSMADIPMQPNVSQQQRYDRLQSINLQMKENEDQWQDDLTKWKNRRKSVNSDLERKKEEREKIDLIKTSKTYGERQEERLASPYVHICSSVWC
ncbi:hypothetical protein ACEWY4_023611 [Coilia grayii]|uniref:DUF4757 domain-containing protein n=1 Tax=Coilia grayii TaxID=363190 RepID=A0ABD1J3I0_9TELE